jgi:hypothetical protein
VIRSLFTRVSEFAGADLVSDVVLPWLEGEGASTWRQIRDLGRAEAARERAEYPVPESWDVDRAPLSVLLWELYAFSRVVEVLVAPYLRPGEGAWEEADLLVQALPAGGAYEAVMDAFGLQRIERSPFHPFFHEIVEVEQADDPDAVPEVVQEIWPGFMLGSLLVIRAGVRVRAGTAVIDKQVAETSRLYWTWWRRSRPTCDLSHGWGRNSQWRTDFRRDYLLGDRLELNVDGERRDLNALERRRGGNLAIQRRIELVTHRCYVRAPGDAAFEASPFGDRYSAVASV